MLVSYGKLFLMSLSDSLSKVVGTSMPLVLDVISKSKKFWKTLLLHNGFGLVSRVDQYI